MKGTGCLRYGVLLTLGLVLGAGRAAAQSSVGTVVLGAPVGHATALHLSSSMLQVGPVDGEGPSVVGTISFDAHARTRASGEVILTVEALRDIEHVVGGASGSTVVIEYAGPADGTVAGVLSTVPTVAGRWTGSGARHGQLTFTIRGPGYLQGGVIPLRFVLTTP